MAHVDLTASSTVSLGSLASKRTFTVVGGDNTTVCSFYVADSASQSSGPPMIDGRDTRGNQLRLKINQSATFDNSGTYVSYTLTGTAPTAVMVDAPGAGTAAVTVATTGAAGAVLLTSAPGSASAPTAVSSTDPRVTTVNVPVILSSSDGSLAETPIAIPGVAGAISAVKVMPAANITQDDTNYLTFTLKIRDGAGGSASSVCSKTTKTTGGGAFLAFQALSLGSLSNTTTTATSVLSLISAKTGTGQAVALPVLVQITVTPTV
jgi:hypothetical protein